MRFWPCQRVIGVEQGGEVACVGRRAADSAVRFERSEIESGGAEPEERRVGLENGADDGCDVVISYDQTS